VYVSLDLQMHTGEFGVAGLEGKSRQFRARSQQVEVVRAVMDHNVMLIGIVVPEILGP